MFLLNIINIVNIISSVTSLKDMLHHYETMHINDIYFENKELNLSEVKKYRNKRYIKIEHLKNVREKLFIKFKAFGRIFKLHFFKERPILTDDVEMVVVNKSMSIIIKDFEFESYLGYLEDEPDTSLLHLYLENGNLFASLITHNDTYTIEPSWRHLPHSQHYSMIIYKTSHMKSNFSYPKISSRCKAITFKRKNRSLLKEKKNLFKEKRSSNTHVTSSHSRCPLAIVCDYTFYQNIGLNSYAIAAKYMIGVISRTNLIYTNSIFGEFIDMGLVIKKIIIHDSNNIDVAYNDPASVNVSNLIGKLASSQEGWQNFCLVHLFHSHILKNTTTLGLAYVSKAKVFNMGGICSYDTLYHGNVAWSNFVSGKNKLISTVGDITVAHEIAHGWGSFHDTTEDCIPSELEDGHYLMFPQTSMGFQKNNKLFSSCSRKDIGGVLMYNANCFISKDSTKSYCGDNIINGNEQCDVGTVVSDKCCNEKCQFNDGAQCSDKNSDCCRNCKYAPKTTLCLKAENSSCFNSSFCDGKKETCPEPDKKDNGTLCQYGGKCFNGICKSACSLAKMNDCSCVGELSCLWCCRKSKTKCKPFVYPNKSYIYLINGEFCPMGHCEQGRCIEDYISSHTVGMWMVFNYINENLIEIFFRNNITFTVIFASLIPYSIFCVFVCYKDCLSSLDEHNSIQWFEKENKDLFVSEFDLSLIKKIRKIKRIKEKGIN